VHNFCSWFMFTTKKGMSNMPPWPFQVFTFGNQIQTGVKTIDHYCNCEWNSNHPTWILPLKAAVTVVCLVPVLGLAIFLIYLSLPPMSYLPDPVKWQIGDSIPCLCKSLINSYCWSTLISLFTEFWPVSSGNSVLNLYTYGCDRRRNHSINLILQHFRNKLILRCGNWVRL